MDSLTRSIIACCIGLCLVSAASSAETLYNGIVLPEQWPPKIEKDAIQRGDVMPVPYLENPPDVIPIDVGRQLFVDDFLVEATNLKRTFHVAEYYADNPVVAPDRRWEKPGKQPTAMAFSDGVWYDPQDRLFKMWYMSGYMATTSLALSEDGIHWDKPKYDVMPGTNVVCLSGHRDSAVVWLDLEATDPKRRYQMFQFHRDPWRAAIHLSKDGIHWDLATWCGESGDRSSIFYNPFRKLWVYSIRTILNPGTDKWCRCRLYWECEDLVSGAHWEGAYRGGGTGGPGAPAMWVGADRLHSAGPNVSEDFKAELYHLDTIAYESLFLGLFSIWHQGSHKGRPKINDVLVGFSRDGFHWHRPFRQAILPVAADSDAWNWSNVQSVGGCCLVVGDKLYFYASGRKSQANSTGLAFMRRDGFASMVPEQADGVLTTRPVVFKGKYLFVNADTDEGELRVEVLDKGGRCIEPFTVKNCVPIQADKTLQRVNWQGAADLSAVAEKPVKFRFHLNNGQLYSFWVTPDESAASNGYVAGGGPGFTKSRDTVGAAAYQAAEDIVTTGTE